jgi:hypothetical protein
VIRISVRASLAATVSPGAVSNPIVAALAAQALMTPITIGSSAASAILAAHVIMFNTLMTNVSWGSPVYSGGVPGGVLGAKAIP